MNLFIRRNRLRFIASALAALALGSTGLARAADPVADYPSRSIKVVVPSPAGGPNDAIARILAQRLEKVLGQTIVVEPRPGGAGLVGADAVARAKPDGYTLLLTYPAPVAVNVTPQDPRGMVDLTRIEPIALVAELEAVFVVHPKVPATDLKSFIAYTESQNGNARVAISAPGNFPALASEKFFLEQKIKARRVNYLGTAPAVKDLLGGHFDGHVEILTGVAPHIRAGKLRAIAVTSKARSPFLPDVPTALEQGYPTLLASAGSSWLRRPARPSPSSTS
ncbi:Bug family tripartite tricarboxylate transporter substrate binding protein [Caldimonas thermodepolymerans]|uniref:Bug family tripartite tricarboxylate transporter substrate binding protein n=1 Tax=Caldimonas thermodepolymerans TaxID=215580 RepID=UPI0022365A44|nr:tripartite tricarboxylate transporter substrate binding protein [Caldimonas thermodepolymerans]UZG42680.1 tripartite tricarboxylate transporter substrate binding protein [Caldimonas thermodepolymerans]